MSKWRHIHQKIFHRKGFGVHSPFVFDLITNVIEQRHPFYAYKDMDLIRLHLRQQVQPINLDEKKSSIKTYLRKQCITKKEGELLFRLTNHYKPHYLLSVGSSMGLIPLYMSLYASNTQSVSLENQKDIADIALKNIEKKAKSPIQIIKGDYQTSLPKALRSLPKIDCIYLSKELSIPTWIEVMEQCASSIHDESMAIISGIHTSAEKRNCWNKLCKDPKITVSVDLYKLGLIFFRPKLHKRMYKSRML